MLPLSGIRVLDLSRLLPGPFATLVLADLGADVVKVEEPRRGDYLRSIPPLAGAESGAFHALNRNKRSLALDLRAEGGAATLVGLARSADVLVESFRPGVLDRLGCGYERLKAERPGLVFCSISGYGQDGPYRNVVGHDLDYCAISGALAANGPAARPMPCAFQVADVGGGAWPAVAGILAALLRRATTGEGARIDVSMTDGTVAAFAMPLAMAWARGSPLAREAELLNGGAACYRTYRTRDGRFVAFAAIEPEFFTRFCEVAGRPDLAPRHMEDGGRGPVEELEAIFAARTRDEWAAVGRESDVCVAPVLEGDEPRHDPQLRARGTFVEVPTPREGRSMPGVRVAPVIEGVPLPLRPAPGLGEHTTEVLREAGFSEAEIAELRSRRVVGPPGA